MKINQIAKPLRREERINPNKEYKILGLRLEGRGLFLREQKFGREIKSDRLFKIKKGDFIYSRLFGWRGSFDIVSEKFDNCFVSSEFPTFILDENQVNAEYLLKYFLLPSILREVERLCEGTTKASRNRFKENKFLNFNIELPPINNQIEIKNKLNTFSNKNKSFNEIQSSNIGFVSSLRQQILQEAVQGKLISQDPKDESASELLKKIKVEKEKLIKEGKIKKGKELPSISEDEIPYEIPKGWEWCNLDNLGDTQTGTTPSTSNSNYFNGNIPFIKPADISNKRINYFNESLTEEGLKQGRLIPKDSLMMVCIGGSTGKTFYTDRECSCNQQINTIKGLGGIMGKFLFHFTSSSYFQERVWSLSTGSATNIINKQKWASIPFPLPPLSEQKRIVEKVDKLMAYCDELEKQVKENQVNSEKLMESVLGESFGR